MGQSTKAQIQQKFGQQVKKIRVGKKLTIEELAKLAGIGTAQLKKIEAGEINPLMSTIVSIARALKVTPELLLAEILI